MPIALLHRIARERLPLVVVREEDVDFIRILVLAGHLKAAISPPITTYAAAVDPPPAVVTAITPLGRQMLECFPLPDPASPATPQAIFYLARIRLFFAWCSSSHSPSASINGGT